MAQEEERRKASLLRSLWFPAIVLAFGISFTAALTLLLRHGIEQTASEQFERQAEQAKNAIATRIQAYTDALYAVRALFETSAHVSQEDFRVFVSKLEVGTRYPALRVLNYAAYVPDGERQKLIERVRSDKTGGEAARNFTIRPPQSRPGYYVITHITPLEGNERSFGLDIGAPPFKPDALEHGRDTGKLLSSGRIIRFEDGVDNIAMRIAVYRPGYPTETVAQRREAYIGSVGAGFRIAELMRGVLEAHNLPHIHFKVLDKERGGKDGSLLFDNANTPAPGAGRVYTTHRQVEMAGRLWELEFSAPQSGLVPGNDLKLPWLVFGAGVLGSLLLATIMFFITSSRHRALLLARKINEELHVQEGRLAEAQHLAKLGSWEISGAKGQMFWSEELYRILGVEKGSRRMVLDDFLDAVHPGDRHKVREMLRGGSGADGVLELEHRLVLRRGGEHWALTKAKLEEPHSGVWRGTTMDITERKRAEFRLQTEHDAARILASGGEKETVLMDLSHLLCTRLNMPCAVQWQVDNGYLLRCERAWCTETIDERELARLQGERAQSPLARLAAQKRAVAVAADLGSVPAPFDVGGIRLHATAALPIVGANTVLGVIELLSDGPAAIEPSLVDLLSSIAVQLGQYHEKAMAEEALQFVAAHDSLTGLPNRLEFQNRLALALARARRDRSQVAILFIDLDRFKLLNDSMGHGAGDRLLQECARRITAALRQSDTVARFGGDEFVVMLEAMDKARDVTAVVGKIQEALKKPFAIEAREFTPSASIGISAYPADGFEPESLLKHADLAMYQAKQQARGGYRFFSASMNEEMEKRMLMEGSLRRALERKEFVLHYQPRVSIKTGYITGVEALLRWQHPERGLVPPLDFIPLAEETGLIVPIGAWVVGEACGQMQAWRQLGLDDLRVGVNLSARQFAEETLVEDIAGVLRSIGVPAQALELEVTETMVMQNAAQAAQTLHELKAMGIGLSIDDFGTGYSSLSYLKMFPFDSLKIDRSFVSGIPEDRDDVAVTQAVIQLARALSMRAVAEGVETQEQKQRLRELGCDEIQGYLVSRPLPAEKLTPVLLENRASQPVPGVSSRGKP
jgi:diguanylate cyclase (GGDEF)-like protein